MAESPARRAMIERLVAAAKADQRITGLLDYGSGSEGRVDQWSDVDVEVFIRDADFDAFTRDWKAWAARLGDLLLAYVGGVGHPWCVYDARPLPLRVDFDLHRASQAGDIPTWPNSPINVEAMVLYDPSGRLTPLVERLVGQSLAPTDPARAFEQVCGDLWYYLLRTHTRLLRDDAWGARFDHNVMVLGNLAALLRLEAGAVERWRVSTAAAGIVRVLTPRRLAQLDACVPGTDAADIGRALAAAALLGREVCACVAEQGGWGWPAALAERVIEVVRPA